MRGGRPKGDKSLVNGSQHTSEIVGVEFVGAKGTKSPINGSHHMEGGGEGGGDDDMPHGRSRMNIELSTNTNWVPQNTVLRSGDVPGGRNPGDGSLQAGAHHPLSSWEQKVISETRRREREDIRMHSPREAAVAGLGGGGWEGHAEYGWTEHGGAEYGGAKEAGGGNFELQNRIVNLTEKVSSTLFTRDDSPLIRGNTLYPVNPICSSHSAGLKCRYCVAIVLLMCCRCVANLSLMCC